MNKEEYKELLKTKEWKEYREKILARDSRMCKNCGSTKYLNVHHIKYIRGRKPWEYPEELLVTLCRDCHSKVHNIENKAPKQEEPSWYMTYFSCFSAYIKLTGCQKDLLMALCILSNYSTSIPEGNVFSNNKYLKNKIREMGLNWTDGQINNEISRLAKINMLQKLERGTYMLNPEYFWKGTMSDRTKLLLNISNGILPNTNFNGNN